MSMRRGSYFLRWCGANLGVALLYFAAARAGQMLLVPGVAAPPVWPPAGLALAAVLLGGTRLWPGVAAGAFLYAGATFLDVRNVYALAVSGPVVAGVAAAAVLQALVAATGIRRWIRAANPFERVRDVFAFLGIVALAAMLGALLGVASLCAGGFFAWREYLPLWRAWCLGDLVGASVLAPLLINAGQMRRLDLRTRRLLEVLLFLATLVLVCWTLFLGLFGDLGARRPLLFLLVPVFLWAGLRFGQLGMTAVPLVVSISSVWGVLHGLGPFAWLPQPEAAFLLQGFLLVLNATGLTLMALLRNHERMEQALRASQNFLDRIIDTIPGPVFVKDERFRLVLANAAGCRLAGHARDELLGRGDEDVFPAALARRFRAGDEAVLAEGRDHVREDEVTDAVGRRQAVLVRTSLFTDPAGRRFLVSILLDITERRRIEDDLRAARDHLERMVQERTLELTQANVALQAEIRERRWAEEALRQERRLFIGGPSVVFKWSPADGWPVDYVSPNVKNEFGYAVAEFTAGQTSLARIIHPEDRKPVQERLGERAAAGATCCEQEYRVLHKDGSCRWVHDFTMIMRDPQGRATHFHGYLQDVTARREAEEERRRLESGIQQTQRLESLGLLAGGIAHDFNNLLTGILGNASLLREQLAADASAAELMMQLETSARRAADLTRQLLAYSGRGCFVLEPVHLPGLVEDMGKLLAVSIPKRIEVRHSFAADLPPVEGDAGQLRQVIMNLVLNAAEAIGEHDGVITVRIESHACDAAYLADSFWNETLPPGQYVSIEVADTGCGMSSAVRARIFDPFFTTKFTGRGLGLAVVLGIVRGHRGAVRVYSESGKGTTFRVLLPAAAHLPASPVAVSDTPAAAAGTWRSRATVLVVDDEEALRTLARHILERAGCTVITAADGQEAVDRFRENPQAVDAVLLDLTMPRMDGQEAYRELRRIRPDVRVLLCSGFSEQDAVLRFAGAGLAGFIQKPYSSEDLRRALERVCAGVGTLAPGVP